MRVLIKTDHNEAFKLTKPAVMSMKQNFLKQV